MTIDVCIDHAFDSGGHNFRLNVEFNSDAGITVIFGHSGAGKSLLLKAIAGLQSVSSGRIVVNQKTLLDSTSRINRRRVIVTSVICSKTMRSSRI